MRIGLSCLLVVAFISGCSRAPQPAGQGESRAGKALHQLFTEEWAARMREEPLFATASDFHDYDDRLPAVTPADFDRRLQQDRGYQERLDKISRGALTHDDQVNYDLFEFILKHRIALAAFKPWRIPLVSDEGFHTEVMRMARTRMSCDTNASRPPSCTHLRQCSSSQRVSVLRAEAGNPLITRYITPVPFMAVHPRPGALVARRNPPMQ